MGGSSSEESRSAGIEEGKGSGIRKGRGGMASGCGLYVLQQVAENLAPWLSSPATHCIHLQSFQAD